MGNCCFPRKLPILLQEELEDIPIEPEPVFYTPMTQSMMSTDEKATELITKLG